MIAQLNPLLVSLHGSLGKINFLHAQGRQLVRRHPIRTAPPTPAQQATRTAMSNCWPLWSDLTPLMQALWNAPAAALAITPYALFVHLNLLTEQLGHAPHPTPDHPDVPPPADYDFYPKHSGAPAICCNWTDNAPPAYPYFVVFFRLHTELVWETIGLWPSATPAPCQRYKELAVDGGLYDCSCFWMKPAVSGAGTSAGKASILCA